MPKKVKESVWGKLPDPPARPPGPETGELSSSLVSRGAYGPWDATAAGVTRYADGVPVPRLQDPADPGTGSRRGKGRHAWRTDPVPGKGLARGRSARGR